MADSRSKNASRNIVFAFTNRTISIVLPFISRTVILYLLGDKYLGIGSLFTSVLSFLSLAELGLGSAIVYSMYKPIAENDKDKICALLAYYKKFYRKIGLFILVLGTLLLPFIPYLIKGDAPAGTNVYILFYIYLLNSVISYFFAGYKQCLLTAHQRTDITSKITMTVNVLIQAGQIAALVLTRNFYVYAIVPIFGTILTNILNMRVTNKCYPELQCMGRLETEDRKAIEKRLSGLVGTKLNSIVVHSADMLVVSAFLGLTETAIYGNYYYIMNAVNSFVILFFSSMTASVGNSLITETREKNHELFKTIGFINAWITGWCTVCLLCLYHPFMLLWAGEKRTYPVGIEVALVVYFFIWSIQRTIFLFKDAAGIWYEDRYRPYVSMVINLVLNFVGVQTIGIYGVVLSSAVAFALSLPWVNYTLFSTLFKKSPLSNLMDMGYSAIVTTGTSVGTYLITATMPLGIKGLLMRAAVCVVVPNLIFAVCYCFKPEFAKVLAMMRSRLRKLKLHSKR